MIWPALPASVTARTMPGPGFRIEADHAGQVGMALDDGRGVGGDLLDIGAGFLVGHHRDVRAFLGERIAQALARGDEVAGGEERDRADLAGRRGPPRHGSGTDTGRAGSRGCTSWCRDR